MSTKIQTAAHAATPAPFAAGQQMTAGEMMMNPAVMEALYKFATVMADSKFTVPKHLQGNVGDCLAVAMQATLWGMHPFTVAQKTHQVGGALGYEAQLVNAVVQNSGAIMGRFHYEYQGDGARLQCRVGAIPRGENEIVWGEWLSAESVTTKNSSLWKTNPKQQLGYLQVKNWARSFTPGAILGVYTPDEIETIPSRAASEKDITPRAEAIAATVEAAPQSLIDAMRAAAADGVVSYQSAWMALTKDQRKSLAAHHDENKALAIQSDEARIIEAATDLEEDAFAADFAKQMEQEGAQ